MELKKYLLIKLTECKNIFDTYIPNIYTYYTYLFDGEFKSHTLYTETNRVT